MVARSAVEAVLAEERRAELERIVRAQRSEQRLVKQARVVLLAEKGLTNEQIAALVGLSAHKVGKRRRRFAEQGLDGLSDRRGRGGRAATATTSGWVCSGPPARGRRRGETQWTVRSLAAAVGIGKSQTRSWPRTI